MSKQKKFLISKAHFKFELNKNVLLNILKKICEERELGNY